MKASTKVGQPSPRCRGASSSITSMCAAILLPPHTLLIRKEESTYMWLNPDTLWDWKNNRTYVPDPTRDAGGRPRPVDRAEGAPLLNCGGSNGNSGNSGAGRAEPAAPGGPANPVRTAAQAFRLAVRRVCGGSRPGGDGVPSRECQSAEARRIFASRACPPRGRALPYPPGELRRRAGKGLA